MSHAHFPGPVRAWLAPGAWAALCGAVVANRVSGIVEAALLCG